MALFKPNHDESSSRRNSADQGSGTSPNRKRSIFSPNRHSPPPPSTTSSSASGFFHRRRSSSMSNSDRESDGRSTDFFGMARNNGVENDPSIRAGRQKVTDAENAEKEADRALMEARQRVKLAREHVQMLEREAVEDVRRAKAKQAEAKLVSKSAKGLGRHGQ